MKTTLKNVFLAALLALAGIALVPGAACADKVVNIYGPGQSKVNIVVLPPRGTDGQAPPALSADFREVLGRNLSFLPFLEIHPVSTLLGGDPSKGIRTGDIDFEPLTLARVDLVMTTGWAPGGDLELRVFETFDRRMLLGKAYDDVSPDRLQSIADRFCSLLMKAITGKSGFFESSIAFVKTVPSGKELFTVSPMGAGLTQITNLGGINLSPAWSWDRRFIAFTRIGGKEHELGILDTTSGSIIRRTFPGNTVISPAYTPKGEIAVTLSPKGTPGIFLLGPTLTPREDLAQSWAIDVSPSFSRDGRKMVFASGRLGGPQIFLLDRDSDQVTRVSYEGKYNTHPRISPDGRLVVYSRQMSGGHRVFLHDLQTGLERQITFGPGSDEQPCFGPDGYFVAFTSTRNGQKRIFLTTRHGDEPRLVRTGSGSASSPAWTPSRD